MTTTKQPARRKAAVAGASTPGSALIAAAGRIDGAQALSVAAMYIRYYRYMEGEARFGEPMPQVVPAADLAAVWAAHARCREPVGDVGLKGPLYLPCSPRLGVTSAEDENGSGKSGLLDLIAYLTDARFGRATRVSGPAFALLMNDYQETALLDEAKKIFGSGRAHIELQGYLLDGYTKGGSSMVVRGGKIQVCKVWGPVAYAAKDELITGSGGDLRDLFARTLWVHMSRPDKNYPEIDGEAAEQGKQIGLLLSAFCVQNRAAILARCTELAGSRVGQRIVAGVTPRDPQLTRPLEAICDVAGEVHAGMCGVCKKGLPCESAGWPDRIRVACDQAAGKVATQETTNALASVTDIATKLRAGLGI